MFHALWQLPILKDYSLRYDKESDTTEILCPNIEAARQVQCDICPYIHLIKSKNISFVSTDPKDKRTISLEVYWFDKLYKTWCSFQKPSNTQ